MGVEDRFQMTLAKRQVQTVESISNIGLLVNFAAFPALPAYSERVRVRDQVTPFTTAQSLTPSGQWDCSKSGASPLLTVPETWAGLSLVYSSPALFCNH